MTTYTDPKKFISKQKDRILAFRDGMMSSLAEDLVVKTPVDTGAYAESHSIGTEPNAKRSESSSNREGRQSVTQFQGKARQNLASDIEGLDVKDFELYAINGAPHASAVEDEHDYRVYRQAARNANNHVSDGVGKARKR